jgi:two-component system copper resistance phosphate regulon response regulator CusR
MNLLLIEDELKTANAIKTGLEEQGYKVDIANDGLAGLSLLDNNNYQLVISDVIMPKMDGINLCRQIRNKQTDIPILLLTALDSKDDLITGFDAGADDYLSKPFDFRELLARIKALTRRTPATPKEAEILAYADVAVNLKEKTVTRSGKLVQLTVKEFNLLEYFMRRPETVISRADLARDIWNMDFNTWTNIVEVYINYLRNKIDKPFGKKLIHNVYGMGYIFKDED